MALRRLNLLCFFALVGCRPGGPAESRELQAQRPAGGAQASSTSSTSAASASSNALAGASSSAGLASAQSATDWKQAIRAERWQQAYAIVSQLPKPLRSAPETRLALGRAALQTGRQAEAVTALAGLEVLLPAAATEIAQWRAEAAAIAGPFEPAAAYLAKSAKVKHLLLAASALQRAHKLKAARKLADRAVRRAQRTRRRSDEAAAHLIRGSIAEAMGQKAIAAGDYRWIIRQRPSDQRVREALVGSKRVGARLPLDEHTNALASSTTRANLADTLIALDALAAQRSQNKPLVAMARARALYRARDNERARQAFQAIAKSASPFAAEAGYYAGRTNQRLRNTERSIAAYTRVTTHHRRSGWAERATFRRAELLLVSGNYRKAASAFARYLSRFGKTSSTEAARYGQAVALLSAGQAKRARPLLSSLRSRAKKRRFEANLQHLEALAAVRSGDKKAGTALWLQLIREQPLTWPALAAHARLKEIGYQPLPALIGASPQGVHTALEVALPAGPALLASLGLDLAAESHLEGIEQEAAARYAGRESEALCGMYGLLSTARRRHRLGGRAVSLKILMRAPAPSERWAWQCVYPNPYRALIREQAGAQQLPPGLIHAIMRQESAFMVRVQSPAGARGLMQLMPNTARRAGEEINLAFADDEITRPDINVRLGSYYLGKLYRGFQQSVPLAVAAYNAGPNAVQYWAQAPGDGQIDLWIARIPYRETRHYVQRVMGNLARYQWLEGGIAAVQPVSLKLPTETNIGTDAY